MSPARPDGGTMRGSPAQSDAEPTRTASAEEPGARPRRTRSEPLTARRLRELDARLMRYASARLGAAAARDAVQDTWEAYLAGDFEGRSKLETYLIGILRRRIVDWYRAARRVSGAEVPERVELPRHEDRLDARRRLDDTAAALARIPSRHRDVLMAIAREDDRAAIASDFGITPGALRTLVHRARANVMSRAAGPCRSGTTRRRPLRRTETQPRAAPSRRAAFTSIPPTFSGAGIPEDARPGLL